MREERLSLIVDGVEIPAVLTRPEADMGAPRLALLLIPGSLNADVDGNYAPMFPGQPPASPHTYLDLARQLAAHGVATLRHSKRGPGTACATRDAALAEERYREFPQRVRVAEAFLGELCRRIPNVPLAIAGHSEGAVAATLLAQRRPDAERLILLSGPAMPLLRLMIWQRQRQSPAPAAAYAQALGWAEDYAAGRALPEDRSANPFGEMFGFFNQPPAQVYLRSVENVDPAAELAKVRQPVLLVQGGRDLSVMEENADLLQAAQPRAEIVRFPELNHFYKRAAEGLNAMESFLLDGESDPAVAAAIAGWGRCQSA